MRKPSKLWLLALVLSGCTVRCYGPKTTMNRDELEKTLETRLAVGGHVRCPEDLEAKVGATYRCQLELENTSYALDVTITSIDPTDSKTPLRIDYKFARGRAFRRSVVQADLQKKLSDMLGAPLEVACGAEPLLFIRETLVVCQLRSGNVRTTTSLALDDKLGVTNGPLVPPVFSRKELEAGLREATKAQFGPDMAIDCGPEAIIMSPADSTIHCQASKGSEKAPLEVVVERDTTTSWKLSAPDSWKVAR